MLLIPAARNTLLDILDFSLRLPSPASSRGVIAVILSVFFCHFAIAHRRSTTALPLRQSTMTIQTQCESEVLRIHNFFVLWLKGVVSKSEKIFEKECGDALASDLVFIKTNGSVVQYSRLLEELYTAYDTQPDFDMKIRNTKVLHSYSDYCLVMYEELHYSGETKRESRQCTALFRANVHAPLGVEWVHIHETNIASYP